MFDAQGRRLYNVKTRLILGLRELSNGKFIEE